LIDDERKSLLMLVLWVSIANLPCWQSREACATQRDIACNPTLKLRKIVEPIYPEEAQENGIRGTVVVEALVDKQGVPQSVYALRGDPLLARAVSEAVQQWRRKPYRLNREAVEVDMTIAVNFGPG
jgi:TonB family protein